MKYLVTLSTFILLLYTTQQVFAGTPHTPDINNNGITEVSDAQSVLKKAINLPILNWPAEQTAGDVNCSGTITTSDALLVLRKAIGLSVQNWCADSLSFCTATDNSIIGSGQDETRTRYQSATVSYGEQCQSEEQVRSCGSGTWDEWGGTYSASACSVGDAQSYTNTELFVSAVYRMVLGREADSAGLASWTTSLDSGTMTGDGLVLVMFNSGEFTNANGDIKTMSDSDYVDVLYNIILKRDADSAGKSSFVSRLVNGDSRGDIMSDILFSPESKNTNNEMFNTGLLIDTRSLSTAGQYIDDNFNSSLTGSFSNNEKIAMVSFFYWYNTRTGGHIYNADGSDALTTHPASYPAYTSPELSYKNVEWYEKEMEDMIEVGIDVMLPVYWGFPQKSAQTNNWSNAIFEPLEQAMQNLEARGLTPPKVGMFYDTSTLKTNPVGRLDLTTNKGKEYFYGTMRDFYSRLAPKRWAQINGKPIVVFYQPVFAKAWDRGAFTYTDTKFAQHFSGKTPYYIANTNWGAEIQADAYTNWGASVKGVQINGDVAQIGPGFDNTSVHLPNLTFRARENGMFYRRNWQELLANHGIKKVLIETWNEWHEGSDIADSHEFGRKYLNMTKNFVQQWKSGVTVNITPERRFVLEAYRTILGREADDAGLQYHESRLNNGDTTGMELLTLFGHSQEFMNKHNNKVLIKNSNAAASVEELSDDEFITFLYNVFLGRLADGPGRTHWSGRLQNGISRSDVMRAILLSDEGKNRNPYLITFMLVKQPIVGVIDSVIWMNTSKSGGGHVKVFAESWDSTLSKWADLKNVPAQPFKMHTDLMNNHIFWRKDARGINGSKSYYGEIFTFNNASIRLRAETFPYFACTAAIGGRRCDDSGTWDSRKDKFRLFKDRTNGNTGSELPGAPGRFMIPRSVHHGWSNGPYISDTYYCNSYNELHSSTCTLYQHGVTDWITVEAYKNYNIFLADGEVMEEAPNGTPENKIYDVVIISQEQSINNLNATVSDGTVRGKARERFFFGRIGGDYYGMVRWDKSLNINGRYKLIKRTIGYGWDDSYNPTFDLMRERGMHL
jgi:hypothetical protein